MQKKQAQESFSIIHKFICYLYKNAENLEVLIQNLEYSFSVLALSETWTSNQEKQTLPRTYKLSTFLCHTRN